MVDLLQQYSNFSQQIELTSLHDQLLQLRGEAEQSSPYVHTPQAKLTTATKQQAVALYARGMSMRQVATELGIGKTSVNRLLHDAQVPLRPRGRPAS